MPQIKAAEFVPDESLLKQYSLFVLFGDDYMVNRALNLLLEALGQNSQNMDVFYGNDDREVSQALATAGTYALLGEGRVVLLKEADFLQSAVDKSQLLENAQAAYEAKDLKNACKCVLSYLGMGGLTLDDVLPQNKDALKEPLAREPFFDEVVAACVKDNLKPKKAEQGVDMLFGALEKGLPATNKLVITAAGLDKRRKVFKALEEQGLLVDCNVPKGDYKADKDAQSIILKQLAADFTKKCGKKIEPGVLDALTGMMGFDLYALNAALAQLADYAGERPLIAAKDVKTLFSRTKADPIYELTSAVAKADLGQSLFYLDSLLTNAKMHPLQVLAAISNQMRKIAGALGFLQSPHAAGWHAGQTYQDFKVQTLPALEQYDAQLLETLEAWERALTPDAAEGTAGKGKKTKKQAVIGRDYLLAKEGKSAYSVYLLLQNAAGYNKANLTEIFKLLLNAESELKLSAANPKLLLEKLLLDLFALAKKK